MIAKEPGDQGLIFKEMILNIFKFFAPKVYNFYREEDAVILNVVDLYVDHNKLHDLLKVTGDGQDEEVFDNYENDQDIEYLAQIAEE